MRRECLDERRHLAVCEDKRAEDSRKEAMLAVVCRRKLYSVAQLSLHYYFLREVEFLVYQQQALFSVA